MRNASHIIFSTQWQRDIFIDAYELDKNKTSIIENYYGPKEADEEAVSKEFVGSSREIFLKNTETIKEIFSEIKKENNDVSFFTGNLPFEQFINKLKTVKFKLKCHI